jgi:hypothetical protein
MNSHPIGTCPNCGARKVSGASACWQCSTVFATLPTTPVSPRRSVKVPWVGVIPLGLFFLPWVIIGRYGVHRVISVSGLELALGQSLRGRLVPHEPLLWLVPCVSLLVAGLLLLRAHRRIPEPWHWLLVAITAGGGLLLLLIKAVQWLWVEPSSEVIWVVHWLTSEYLVSVSAFLVSALTAMRAWLDARGPRSLSSSSASEDTPVDEEQIR